MCPKYQCSYAARVDNLLPVAWGRGSELRPEKSGHRKGARGASGATDYRDVEAWQILALAKAGGGKVKTTRRLAVLTVGIVAAALTVTLAGTMDPARGASVLPQGFTQTTLTNALVAPHDMEFAPDYSGRLFVAQQGGIVRVLHPDRRLTTFLDISSQVYQQNSMGLIGITIDPQFATNRFVYLLYTRKATATAPIHNRIVRVTADASGDGAVPGSEQLLLRLNDLLDNGLHNGGSMKFGERRS